MNPELEQAYALVLADLEDRNSHVIGRLLEWDITGGEDEHLYRTWLVAKNYLYSEGQGYPLVFLPKNYGVSLHYNVSGRHYNRYYER